MGESWPDPAAEYEFPGGDNDNEQRWQQEVNGALAGGALNLVHRTGAVYSLRGTCPRCGHRMSQVIDFAIYAPKEWTFGRPSRPGTLTLDVVCSCPDPHSGRGAGVSGCGWGRGIPVTIEQPPAGPSQTGN